MIMTQFRHGVSIGIERIGSDFFLSVKAIGKLTHKDYEIISPMINSAIKDVKEPEINVFIDASEFEGWELRAAWDDFKLGMKHNKKFKKIAIVGNKKWQAMVVKIGSWFVSGEVKIFEDSDRALSWLLEV